MSFEAPQPGNPHQLTINQHVFPKASIDRFTENGRVQVSRKSSSKNIFTKQPKDALFCANRAWSEQVEKGLMWRIEDKFQSLAEAIIDGRVTQIGYFERPIVNDFFALWNIRCNHKTRPMQDQKINGISGLEHELSKNEQEILEKKWYSFVRPDHSMPGRQLAAIQILMNIDFARVQYGNTNWGITRLVGGELIVPDISSNIQILPINPKLCLIASMPNQIIKFEIIRQINHIMFGSSKEYFFARNFSACPF